LEISRQQAYKEASKTNLKLTSSYGICATISASLEDLPINIPVGKKCIKRKDIILISFFTNVHSDPTDKELHAVFIMNYI